MRVLQLVPDLGVGGAERMVVQLSTALRASGHSIRIVTMYDRIGSYLEAEASEAGVELVGLGKQLGFDGRMFIRLGKAIAEFQPDLVHTHRYVLRYYLPTLLTHRVPVVHTVHNMANKEVGWTGRLAHRVAFRLGVAVVGIGEEVSRSIENTYRLRVRATIPHGIPVSLFAAPDVPRAVWRQRERLPPSAFVFVAAARLAAQKRIDVLLRAFAKVRAQCESYVLVAGDGPLRRSLEELSAKLHISDYVRFLGVRGDMPNVLAAADAFVLSSAWEGNPLSVMEAMAAGLPVISMNVGGVREFVRPGETGLLVAPGDEAAFAVAMATLAHERERASAFGSAGAIRAGAHFGIERMASQYEELYRAIIGDGGRTARR